MPAPTEPRRRVPRQDRSREKVARILEAARRILEADGAAALNTNRVAREAGVGVGSVYEYFADKRAIAEQLIETLAEEEARAILATFEASAGSTLAEGIRAIVEATVVLYRENATVFQGLRSLISGERRLDYRPGERLILEEIQRRFAEHRDELAVDDIERAAVMSFHIVESLSARIAPDEALPWTEAERVDEIDRAVCRYLGITPASRR